MKAVIGILIAVLLVGAASLAAWRQADRRAERRASELLVASAAVQRGTYEPQMVRDLPVAAQRYFNFMIDAGAPLRTVVELEMVGEIGNGTREEPNYRDMQARQILAPPHGLLWRLESGALSGSDAALPDRSWTRFWLFGIFPVVRAGGADHRRSAFGRVVAEAAFWVPASLLPGDGVRWEHVDDRRARAVVKSGALEQAVEITLDASGTPHSVVIPRWSNENADKQYRLQPFGGILSAFEHVEGYRLPRRVEGGNHFGTPAYFPFYRAQITAFRFP